MPPTVNGQWEVAGLLIGQGTAYPIDQVSGLGSPAVRSAELQLSDRDGGWAGVDRLETREIVLAVGVDGTPDTSAYGALFDALMAAWAPRSDDITVTWQRFGRRRRVLARPRGLVVDWNEDFHLGAAKVAGRFICQDPIIYDDNETTVTGTGTVVVTNGGNYPTWATVTITGPTAAVTLRNTTDQNRAISLTELPGTTTVDLKRKTVTSGGSDVFHKVSPGTTWWRVLPGANSLQLTGATSFTVTFRSGWISA